MVTPAAAVGRCVERFLARPGIDAESLERLVAKTAQQAAEPVVVQTPEGVYQAACKHCHEAGPGTELRGRPWSVAAIRAAVRGTETAPHPGRLMPPFTSGTVNDRILESLAPWLSAAKPGHRSVESAKFPGEAPPGGPARR